jgi:hypothetical protein
MQRLRVSINPLQTTHSKSSLLSCRPLQPSCTEVVVVLAGTGAEYCDSGGAERVRGRVWTPHQAARRERREGRCCLSSAGTACKTGLACGEDGGGRGDEQLRGIPKYGATLVATCAEWFESKEKGATLNPGIPDPNGEKGRRETWLLWDGWGGSLGKITNLPYPPITVQSLNSPIISIFVQSHSHSPGHRFSSGSENHARSQLRHPLSAPESRTLCDPEVSTSNMPFPLPGPGSVWVFFVCFLILSS